MRKEPQSGFFNTGEVAINYSRWHSGSARRVLLLHGISGRLSTWLDTIAALGGPVDVTAVDLRGHGRSGHARGYYRVPDYARDVERLIVGLDLAPVVIVGHSLGGIVGMWAAAARPKTVRGLLLEDPPFFARDIMERDAPERYDGFVGLSDLVKARLSLAEIEFVLARENPDLAPENTRSSAEALFALDPDVLQHVIDRRIDWTASFARTARRITCPAALLHGEFEHGGWVREADLARITGLIGGLKLERWSDFGHSLHAGDPVRFAERQQRFLASLN